jgi:hypothetical protein
MLNKTLNIATGRKRLKIRCPCFLTFFDTIKNEQARALALFSDGPHSKLEVEKANKTVHRARNILEYSRRRNLKVGCTLYSSNKCTSQNTF